MTNIAMMRVRRHLLGLLSSLLSTAVLVRGFSSCRDARHFSCAMVCYLEDDDYEFRKEVFAYAKKECSGLSDEANTGEEKEPDVCAPTTMRKALAASLCRPRRN